MTSLHLNEMLSDLRPLSEQEIESIAGGHEDCQVSMEIRDGRIIVTGVDGDGC